MELCTDNIDQFLFQELKHELEKIPNFSDITPLHLQHQKMGPCITSAYRKLRSQKRSSDSYITHLMGFVRSPFRDFGSYLKIVVGLDEDDIQLI